MEAEVCTVYFQQAVRYSNVRIFPDEKWIEKTGPIKLPTRSPDASPLEFF